MWRAEEPPPFTPRPPVDGLMMLHISLHRYRTRQLTHASRAVFVSDRALVLCLLKSEVLESRILGDKEHRKGWVDLRLLRLEEKQDKNASGGQKRYTVSCDYIDLSIRYNYKSTIHYINTTNHPFSPLV